MPKRIDPADRFVGQNIRIFRKAKRISQTELGHGVGVTFQQIQKYENGTNRVGSSRLMKIAEFLDVPIIRFFDNAAGPREKPIAGTVVTDLLSSPYAVQMLQAFAKIPRDEVRRNLVVLTQSLIEHAKK
jgi:transcriptional regulator with XRE-family HTH domain